MRGVIVLPCCSFLSTPAMHVVYFLHKTKARVKPFSACQLFSFLSQAKRRAMPSCSETALLFCKESGRGHRSRSEASVSFLLKRVCTTLLKISHNTRQNPCNRLVFAILYSPHTTAMLRLATNAPDGAFFLS